MCFQDCAKYLLVILNIAIFVAGFFLTVTGLILLFESGLLHNDVINLFEMIRYWSVKFGLVLQFGCFIMIVTGGLVMIVAVVGIVGAWKKVKCCLIVFVLILAFTILLQVTLVRIWININIRSDEWLKGEMLSLLTNYKGPHHNDTISKGYNKLFIKARCCGVNSYADMKDHPTNWYTTVGANQSPTPEKVPATCCKDVETDADIVAKVESICTTTPQNYYTEGCFNVVNDRIFASFLIIVIVAAIAFLIEVTAIVMSFMVLCQAKNRIAPSSEDDNAVLKNKGKQ